MNMVIGIQSFITPVKSHIFRGGMHVLPVIKLRSEVHSNSSLG